MIPYLEDDDQFYQYSQIFLRIYPQSRGIGNASESIRGAAIR